MNKQEEELYRKAKKKVAKEIFIVLIFISFVISTFSILIHYTS